MPEELNRRVDLLVTEVHGLREGVQAVRDELAEANERAAKAETTAKRSRSWVKVLGVSLAVSLLLAGAAFGGAFTLIERNNTKWCGTLNILTDPSAPAPSTARGRDQLAQLEALRIAFNCKRTDTP